MPDNEDEDVKKNSSIRKQTAIRLSGRGVLIVPIAFDFFYDMDPTVIQALKLKQNV